MSLPAPFLQTLAGVVGFNKAAFEAVHTSGETVTAIRVNPNKIRIKFYLSTQALCLGARTDNI